MISRPTAGRRGRIDSNKCHWCSAHEPCEAVTHGNCVGSTGWALFITTMTCSSLIKMPLGVTVGLGPGRIVLHGDPALPLQKGHSSPLPLFIQCLLWPRSPISATAELLFLSASHCHKAFIITLVFH